MRHPCHHLPHGGCALLGGAATVNASTRPRPQVVECSHVPRLQFVSPAATYLESLNSARDFSPRVSSRLLEDPVGRDRFGLPGRGSSFRTAPPARLREGLRISTVYTRSVALMAGRFSRKRVKYIGGR